MKRKVVYFTRTGTCKQIAERIANSLSVDPIQILDHQNWKGFIGYWKAGFYASTNREVVIEVRGDLTDADEILVVTPIWAGSIAPATKAFLKSFSKNKVHLVVSSNGSLIKDRAGFNSIFEITKSKKNENLVISEITNKFSGK